MRLGRPPAAAALNRRRALAPVVAVAVTLTLAGCGEHRQRSAVAWVRPPLLFVAPGLPGDRILTGQVRNDTATKLDLTGADFAPRAADGRRVPAHVVLLAQFTHRLPPYNRDDPVTRSIEERTGVRSVVAPGATTPVTFSWHQPAGAPVPTRIEVRGAALAVPAHARRP